MDFDLTSHPLFPMLEVTTVRVVVDRAGPRRMKLRYLVEGDISAIAMPSIAPPARADELWRRTCFELFLSRGRDPYVELNFSPSGEWACYVFFGYRSGRQDRVPAAMPRIDLRVDAGLLELGVVVDLSFVLERNVGIDWLLGLSAIIERQDGVKSYWALRHPPGEPDFHHKDCFAGVLPAATFA